MTTPAQNVIRAVAVPRLDAGAVGIHLAWSGPELSPLATGGYEIRRRPHIELKTTTICAVFDAARLASLAQTRVLPDELGVMLLHDWHPIGAVVQPVAVQASAAAHPSMHFAGVAHAENIPWSVFTQEITTPTQQVSVRCTATSAFAFAISGGKTVAATAVASTGTVLSGQDIDTVVVYARVVSELTICCEQPAEAEHDAASWAKAEVIASGLTLPLHETDPTLNGAAEELRKGRERLVGSETLTAEEANHLAAALRRGAGDLMGRPADRVLLDRTDVTNPYQETLFSARIGLVTLDPRLRRVLGFGHADRTAVPGQTYDYLVSGRFDVADLADAMYDVHQIPSGTALPPAFRIGDIVFRFGGPTQVVLDPAPDPAALTGVSRHGLPIAPGDPIDGFVSWWTPGLSCVIDLPRAVDRVVFEVPHSHNLSCAGALSTDSGGGPAVPIPAGPLAVVSFASPVDQLRISGTGTLYALRVPVGASGQVELHRALGPVQLAAIPLPAPPLSITADNLQTPPAIITGEIGEQTAVAARPQPGFRVSWVPSTVGLTGGWPADLVADPPIDALAFVIEHRRVYEGGGADPWEPIQAGDNLTFGSWPATTGAPSMAYGADLNVAFPLSRERQLGAAVVMAVTDVLSEVATTDDPARAAAPLGSSHEYRIEAMDVVGRVSATWTQSTAVRLEKHIPPPLPTGPQPPPTLVGTPPRLSAPPGVRARTVLATDPDLNAADSTLLAGHASATVIEWGWRQTERDLDPTTQEFLVYVQSRVPTTVPGTITSVAAAPGQWVLDFTTDRTLVADECAGQWLVSAGQAFRIVTHTAGSTPQLTVAASLINPTLAPAAGSTVFGRPLAAEHQRPATWETRVAVVPLTAADTYSYVVFDLLSVTAESRTDAAWIGVSAADGESYVDDELPAAALNGGRPGNESSIASVTTTARYRGRPEFSVPPPLGDVPEIVTDEPTGRSLSVAFDGSALLSGAVATNAVVALDRCPLDAVLAITSLDSAGDVAMRRADGTNQVIVFPNPGDEAAVKTALASAHPERLDSRYFLYLAGIFDHTDELFTRTDGQLRAAGTLTDQLAPKPGRYFYRVRIADASGAVSIGGAILPVVVRVPSTMPMPAPTRRAATVVDGSLTVQIGLEPDPDLAWALLFSNVTDWDVGPPDPAGAQLLRVPNRRDLYPDGGVRLRLADGTILTPVTLSVAAATVDADGLLDLAFNVSLPAGGVRQVQYWCWALSRDGIPSRALGPHTLGMAATP